MTLRGGPRRRWGGRSRIRSGGREHGRRGLPRRGAYGPFRGTLRIAISRPEAALQCAHRLAL